MTARNNPKFSFYKGPVTSTSPYRQITLRDAYVYISTDYAKARTIRLRQIDDKEANRQFKAANFDFVTFSGSFTTRNEAGLLEHSGYLVLDFDHLEDVQAAKAQLLKDPYFETQLLFVSPNGNGLKWIIEIDVTGQYTHGQYFVADQKRKEMNCTEANKTPCTHIMTYHYNQAGEVKRNDVWFKAPNRNETTPSLKVNRIENIWYDYGSGKGGRPVDLVCYLSGVSVAGALLILSGIVPAPVESFSFDQQETVESGSIQIKHVQPLQNRALIQYMGERKISPSTARKFIQEAYYQVSTKQYFALAFMNDLGGYELRNKYFKGGSSPKAITTIPGNPKAVNVFEGFMDFISALEHYRTKQPENTTIVLNSLINLTDEVFKALTAFRKINLYLDNDQAGKSATEQIKSRFQNVIDHAAIIYPNYKDFNELLTSKI
ncbi:MAG: toprim domain-containing protein [Mangrovibacterium sp.]